MQAEGAFTSMLTLHAVERAELLAAGVARKQVNTLYPLDFAHLSGTVAELLTLADDRYLTGGEPAERQWDAQYNLLAEIEYALVTAANWRQSADGVTAYEHALWEALAAPASKALRAAVEERLLRNWSSDWAYTWSSTYMRGLFIACWLLSNGLPRAVTQHEFDALILWIFAHQLPPVNLAARA